VADCCVDGNELLGSSKGGEFLDCVSDYKRFKNDSASWGQRVCL
jgi:hypothetical protein